MPTVTIRLSADEKAETERRAQAAGVSLSEYVRNTLHFDREAPTVESRVNAHERLIVDLSERIARLEGDDDR